MKLYSLIKSKRLIKSQNLKIYLFIGATVIILGGFFYSRITLAKSSSQTNKSTNAPSPVITSNDEITKKLQPISSISSTTVQSTSISKFNLSKLKKELSIDSLTTKMNASQKNNSLKNNIANILIGTPMENMIEPISKQDKLVAAFLVGIALKESGFGKHAPVLNGQDCYNYWGYRGKRKKMGTGGHTCFNSPEDAVATVGKRLHTLAIKQNKNTPRKMLVWKCGSSCNNTGGMAAANKWVKDVSIYFDKIYY